jgi:hypothetical protein
MSDNLRRYRAIRDALTQWYPGQPTGSVARHLTTLAALISGIVGSKSTQLPSAVVRVRLSKVRVRLSKGGNSRNDITIR